MGDHPLNYICRFVLLRRRPGIARSPHSDGTVILPTLRQSFVRTRVYWSDLMESYWRQGRQSPTSV